ncbi:hypothetical protein HYW59_00090 [Candidatus Kaiserbacteria bacterium]|nr:hypothetical protein [Candidatus Kaiserbacteria bacterium]
MIEQNVRETVARQLASGMPRANIEKMLSVEGFSQEEIGEIFSTNRNSASQPTQQPLQQVAQDTVHQHTHFQYRRYLIPAAVAVTVSIGGAALIYAYVAGGFDALISPRTSSCESGASPQDAADAKRLNELKAELSTLSDATLEDLNPEATNEESASYFAKMSKLYEKMDELQSEYTDIQSAGAKRQFEALPDAVLSSIYSTYCGKNATFKGADLFGVEHEKITQDITDTDATELVCKLQNKEYPDDQLPTAIHYVGFKAAISGRFDTAFQFYGCAAEHYYDTPSMYRIAQVYALGSDSFKDAIDDTSIGMEIPQDLKRAYFWIAALAHTELMQQYGMLDAGTQLGWNAIALLDSLQNEESLSDEELVSIEDEAITFVSARYPSAVENRYGVYNHSMRAMIPALEAAQQDPSRIYQSPDDPSTYYVEPIIPE